MKKRIKLKKQKQLSKVKLWILAIVLIMIVALICIYIIGKKINNKIMNYSEIEITKISKLIINNAVNESFADSINSEDLFSIMKNENGDIQSIDFNTIEVNKILSQVNDNIIVMFQDFENGESKILDLNKNLITNTNFSFKKKGIVMEVPIGIITDNAVLSNIGPKIPVKLSLSGELESSVSTKVENYGINNAVMNVYLNIKVSEQIILPLKTKKITITNTVPVMVKMIQGKIPNYYANGINNSSNLLSIPIED